MFICVYNDELDFIIMKRALKTVLEKCQENMYNRESKSRRSEFSYTVIL